MRLSQFQKDSIKKSILSRYSSAEIYLFGSRVDESKRGGDIDLYVKLPQKPHFLDKPQILASLKRAVGEQKIDLIFSYPDKEQLLIDKEALESGVKL